MSGGNSIQYWTVWYPKAAATGILLGRGRLDATDILLVHAAPQVMTVEVHDAQGNRLAYGKDLEQTQDTPITRLRIAGDQVTREDIWPNGEDIGLLVMLPGGEVGTLQKWWHASDRKEWRWQVEFYNSNR
jgi:hypothetical protein